MSVDISGTNCDQCLNMVQCCFTSTETVRLIRTDSPGRPPRLSHSSWTLMAMISNWCHKYPWRTSRSPPPPPSAVYRVTTRKCSFDCYSQGHCFLQSTVSILEEVSVGGISLVAQLTDFGLWCRSLGRRWCCGSVEKICFYVVVSSGVNSKSTADKFRMDGG